jgi:uncharacterized protein YjbI with pentapeptide repeats
MQSIDPNDPNKRILSAIALCAIVILALVWKLYENLGELSDTTENLNQTMLEAQDSLDTIEEIVHQNNLKNAKVGQHTLAFQTRNSLYSMVPCDRIPGGLCPISSNLIRRADMVRKLFFDIGTTDFKGVNLQAVDLSGLDFSGADFSYAQLDYADFSGTRLINADFRHASMNGTNLTGADLTGAILVGADLSNAGMENAKLINSKLQAANLTEAHACLADFAGAKLGSSNLTGIYIWGSDFSKTDLSGRFNSAKAGEDTLWRNDASPKERGVETISYKEANPNQGPLAPILPSYGPDAAPFLGKVIPDGTICPRYVLVERTKSNSGQ